MRFRCPGRGRRRGAVGRPLDIGYDDEARPVTEAVEPLLGIGRGEKLVDVLLGAPIGPGLSVDEVVVYAVLIPGAEHVVLRVVEVAIVAVQVEVERGVGKLRRGGDGACDHRDLNNAERRDEK